MLKIGLTGGIGSGKSTAARLFAQYNVPIIDADAITHALSQPGYPGYNAIVAHFGDAILDHNQKINRKQLGQLIFNDESAKIWLEETLHPLILSDISSKIQTLELKNPPYCIIDIPLITDKKQFNFLDRILVVDCSTDQQIQRVKKRDNMSEKLIKIIINHQCSHQQRLAIADDILPNNSTTDALENAIRLLHLKYMKLATPNK